MDLGDIIVPLVLIGGALVQWWTSRKKDSSPDTREPEAFPDNRPRDSRPDSRSNPEFDELMEALGQAPKKEEVRENRIPPPPLPRPMLASRPMIPEQPVYAPRPEEPETVVQDNISSHDEDLDKRFSRFSSFDLKEGRVPEQMPVPSLPSGKSSPGPNRWRQDLRGARTLRKAVVFNEILQPPLALRPGLQQI